MPIFGHLDTLPICLWDESRQAINAYEMLNNGNWLVTYFMGAPDLWNTKPPLLIWLQALCMKFIGVNEIAVRLPSALAAFFTCTALLWLGERQLKNFWLGFITVLVLVTTNGYIHLHATRTGDYDALLTLFTTLSGLSFFVYTETKQHRYLYYFFGTITLGVLTKGIAGLLFLPAIILYAVYRGMLFSLLKDKHSYLGSAGFLLIVVGFYLPRETYSQGYLMAVYNNELGGRYLETLENHEDGFWYYYQLLLHKFYQYWFLWLPGGMAVGLASKDKSLHNLLVFSLMMTITFWLIISTAQTKLGWYMTPLYPYFAIIVAAFINYIFRMLMEVDYFQKNLSINVIPAVFLFLVFVKPYRTVIKNSYWPRHKANEMHQYSQGYYLKDALLGKHDVDGYRILYKGYYAHLLFYVYALKDQGIDIGMLNWKDIPPNSRVMVNQEAIKQYLHQHYHCTLLDETADVQRYRVLNRKES